MNVAQAVARIKAAAHDISDEYSNERCIEFLNTAIQQAASLLIANKWPPMAQELTLHDGETLPDNYMVPCGQYPIRITNNEVTFLDDDLDNLRFRYFATPAALTNVSDDMPFAGYFYVQEAIVKLAIALALNENEYDISQDSTLNQELMQAIAGGMGANLQET